MPPDLPKEVFENSHAFHAAHGRGIVLLDDEKPVEVSLESAGVDTDGDAALTRGDIYVGRVENIQKNIQAAFVRVTGGQMGYLPLSDRTVRFGNGGRTEGPLRAGEEILVQVEKEAVKKKLPYLTANLNIAGNYFAFTSSRVSLEYSRQLHADEKKALSELLSPLYTGKYGVIVRTNAAGAAAEDLRCEWAALEEEMDRICLTGPSRKAGTCLKRAGGYSMELIRKYAPSDLKEIVTDDQKVYDEIAEEVQYSRSFSPKLRLYDDSMVDLCRLCRIPHLLRDLFARKVWMKSGGFLVIEQTEAFVCIDVNTGKYTGHKNMQDTIALINREAAAEAAAQIRLRNLSGTILIDFISSSEREAAGTLCGLMRQYTAADPVPTQVIDMTALQIMEITRQKTRKSLAEQWESIYGRK